jgi:hypothetical protein
MEILDLATRNRGDRRVNYKYTGDNSPWHQQSAERPERPFLETAVGGLSRIPAAPHVSHNGTFGQLP